MMVGEASQKGLLVIVVGPSGSGKDTLLKAVQADYQEDKNVLFVQRAITRPPSEKTENFISLSQEHFNQMEASGEFCVSWQAHGLSYGVPRALCCHIEQGSIAFLNGARRALSDLVRLFPNNKIIHITANKKSLAERLMKRGREEKGVIERRLASSEMEISPIFQSVTIDNSDTLEKALAKMRVVTTDIIKKHRKSEVA